MFLICNLLLYLIRYNKIIDLNSREVPWRLTLIVVGVGDAALAVGQRGLALGVHVARNVDAGRVQAPRRQQPVSIGTQ